MDHFRILGIGIERLHVWIPLKERNVVCIWIDSRHVKFLIYQFISFVFFHRRIKSRRDTELNLAVSEDDCGGESNIKYLEHVLVIIHARFARRGYLEGYVTSPSGTVSQILPYRPYDVIATDFNNWPILSLHFWGENPQGTWKLRLRNHFPDKEFSGTYYFNLFIQMYCLKFFDRLDLRFFRKLKVCTFE